MPEASLPDSDNGGAKGVLILVVGPSGAGKDTLIRLAREGLASDPRFLFVRRVVTRDTSRWEDHDSLPAEAFEIARQRGDFVLSWEAHGLHYGIPNLVADAVRSGCVAVCNASRGIIGAAHDRFPRVRVVLVTAEPKTLAERLKQRGREPGVTGRLDRAMPDVNADLLIANDGPPEAGALGLKRYLLRQADTQQFMDRE